jgi:hypothetical protein
MNTLDDAVAALAPIGLDEVLRGAALTDRVDRKYLVTAEELRALVDGLRDSHAALAFDGSKVSRYSTVYADRPDLWCHRAHLQGRRRRWKARTRRYLDTDLARLEVKTKGARGRTVKEFREIAVGRHGRFDGDAEAFVSGCLLEAYGERLDLELVPALEVRFRRATLVDLDHGERLTIDVDVDLSQPDGRPVGSLLPGCAIVESKVGQRPGSADATLRSLGIRATSCSKYGLGMALSHPGIPAADLRPLLRRWVRPAPAGEQDSSVALATG